MISLLPFIGARVIAAEIIAAGVLGAICTPIVLVAGLAFGFYSFFKSFSDPQKEKEDI